MGNGNLKGMALTGLACFVAGGLAGYWLSPAPAVPQRLDAVAANPVRMPVGRSGETISWPAAHDLDGFRLTEVVMDGESGEYTAWVQDADGLSSQYSVGDVLPGNYEIRSISPDRLIATRDGQDNVLTLTPDAAEVMATEDGTVASEELMAQVVVKQMLDSSQKMIEQMQKTQEKPTAPEQGR